MPSDQKPNPSEDRVQKEAQRVTRQSALALELPFTLVGAVAVGGVAGYFLDKWLHSDPWLMVVLGALGFAGGVREVVRRLQMSAGDGDGSRPA